MWSARLLIAAGVCGSTAVLFVLAFLANGWMQIRDTHTYTPPQDLIDIVKLVFAASVAVLSLGALSERRRLTTEKDESNAEETNGPDTDKPG